MQNTDWTVSDNLFGDFIGFGGNRNVKVSLAPPRKWGAKSTINIYLDDVLDRNGLDRVVTALLDCNYRLDTIYVNKVIYKLFIETLFPDSVNLLLGDNSFPICTVAGEITIARDLGLDHYYPSEPPSKSADCECESCKPKADKVPAKEEISNALSECAELLKKQDALDALSYATGGNLDSNEKKAKDIKPDCWQDRCLSADSNIITDEEGGMDIRFNGKVLCIDDFQDKQQSVLDAEVEQKVCKRFLNACQHLYNNPLEVVVVLDPDDLNVEVDKRVLEKCKQFGFGIEGNIVYIPRR